MDGDAKHRLVVLVHLAQRALVAGRKVWHCVPLTDALPAHSHARLLPAHRAHDTLGVPNDATQKEIRSAYRKLVLQYHPDKCSLPEDECTAKFESIQKAYELLTKHGKRGESDDAPPEREERARPPAGGGGSGSRSRGGGADSKGKKKPARGKKPSSKRRP